MMTTPRVDAQIAKDAAAERRLGCMPRWRENWYSMRDLARRLERQLAKKAAKK